MDVIVLNAELTAFICNLIYLGINVIYYGKGIKIRDTLSSCQN